MSPLDQSLAEGRISKMSYVLARMKEAEADAERIMTATPEAQPKRLALQYDERGDNRPKPPRRYHS